MLEYFKSLFENLESRISSPFLGAFSIAFIVYNWQAIYLLIFSDGEALGILEYVMNTYGSLWALLIPLIISILYVSIMPWINYGVLWVQNFAQIRYVDFNHEKKLSLLTKEVAIAEEEFKVADARSGKKEIETLLQQIRDKDNLIDIASEQYQKLETQFSNLEENSKRNIVKIETELSKYKSLVEDLRKENLQLLKFSSDVDTLGDFLSKLDPFVINYLMALLNGESKVSKHDYNSQNFKYGLEDLVQKKLINIENKGNFYKITLTDAGAIVLNRFVSK